MRGPSLRFREAGSSSAARPIKKGPPSCPLRPPRPPGATPARALRAATRQAWRSQSARQEMASESLPIAVS